VSVPSLIGGQVDDARLACDVIELTLYAADQDGRPLGEIDWPGHYVVRWQSPEAGEKATRGDIVTIHATSGGGDGSGDREPRPPNLDPPITAVELDEPRSYPDPKADPASPDRVPEPVFGRGGYRAASQGRPGRSLAAGAITARTTSADIIDRPHRCGDHEHRSSVDRRRSAERGVGP